MTSSAGDAEAVGVVEDVADDVVALHHALGKAGRPRGVHDVGGAVGIDGGAAARQLGVGDRRRRRAAGPPRRACRAPASPSRITRRSAGAAPHASAPARCARRLGQQLLDHRQIVDAVRAVGGDQRRRVRLGDDVRHVAGAEAGVDRHQHRADLGDGEEQEDELRPVAEPQADVIAGRDAGGDQRLGGAVDLVAQLGERPAPPLEPQRLALRPALRRRGRSGHRSVSFSNHIDSPAETTDRARRSHLSPSVPRARQLDSSPIRRSRRSSASATLASMKRVSRRAARVELAGAAQAHGLALDLGGLAVEHALELVPVGAHACGARRGEVALDQGQQLLEAPPRRVGRRRGAAARRAPPAARRRRSRAGTRRRTASRGCPSSAAGRRDRSGRRAIMLAVVVPTGSACMQTAK